MEDPIRAPDLASWLGRMLAEMPEGDRLVAGEEVMPLGRILDILLDQEVSDVDSGLVDLASGPLDALAASASIQAAHVVECMHCLLELLRCRAMDALFPVTPQTLHRVARQLLLLMAEHERWLQLVGNARYYGDHPDVADEVVRFRLR